MSVFLIVVGIIGILVSLYNLYAAALYVVAQWRFPGQAGVDRNTVWQLNALPVLSTALVFALRHWILAVAVLLPTIQMLLMALPNMRRDEEPSVLQMAFPQVSGFVGRVIVIFGPAAILTLSLTGQNGSDPTLLSWHFPVLIAAFWVVTWLASGLFAWLVGVLAQIVSRRRT